MLNIIVYGVGRGYERRKQIIDRNIYNIVEFWDRSPEMQGRAIDGVLVTCPHADVNVDKIIITSNIHYNEMYSYLVNDLHISSRIIEKYSWFEKQIILKKYNLSMEDDIQTILTYLKTNDLGFMNYEWTKEYLTSEIQVVYDEDAGMFYHLYKGKPLYIKKNMDDLYMVEQGMDEKLKAQTYVRTLLLDQDPRSPHFYFENLDCTGKTVIDLGAAEGDFSLDVIDKCKRAILVEYDDEWIEALGKTFENYKEKVIIVPKFIGKEDAGNSITLESLVKMAGVEDSDQLVIKMDIEGAEEMVLEAGKEYLSQRNGVEILCCTYHHSMAYEDIKRILIEMGFNVSVSKGRLFFTVANEDYTVPYNGQKNEVDLRKGVVFARK